MVQSISLISFSFIHSFVPSFLPSFHFLFLLLTLSSPLSSQLPVSKLWSLSVEFYVSTYLLSLPSQWYLENRSLRSLSARSLDRIQTLWSFISWKEFRVAGRWVKWLYNQVRKLRGANQILKILFVLLREEIWPRVSLSDTIGASHSACWLPTMWLCHMLKWWYFRVHTLLKYISPISFVLFLYVA